MGVLDNLKIPRGDRSDWAAKEYLLIDNVSINKTEIDNAKEGYPSLLQNLNTKYASKTYVQLAIASPNPSEIVISDIGISPFDVGKIGYSLQINNAGTGLIFSNTYKLGNGDLIDPALSFSTGVNMGLYASTGTNTEILNFKLNGSAVANITTNTVSGVSTINLGSVVLSSNGGISSGSISATGNISSESISATGNISTTEDITCVTANVIDIVATGTSSTFAGAEVVELNTTGPSIFSGTVTFNYSPNTVYIANTFPYSVNNYILSGYSSVQQAIDCNNSPTFTTSPTTGPRSTGFVQTFIGLDTEAGRATQVFYDGINKRLSMRYYNGTTWDASWVGFAREQGHTDNQFFAADATDGKHVVNKGQMEAAILAAAGTGPAGPAGPAGAGGQRNFYQYAPSNVYYSGTNTYNLLAGKSIRVLLKGAGGPSGSINASPGSVTAGTRTKLYNGANSFVEIYPGSAGTNNIPGTASLSLAHFNTFSDVLYTAPTVTDVHVHYVCGNDTGQTVGPTGPTTGPVGLASNSLYTVNRGSGGPAVIGGSTSGQRGQSGGWVLIEIYNDSPSTYPLTIEVGVAPTRGEGYDGYDGVVVIWGSA